jgi:hypothetical protein
LSSRIHIEPGADGVRNLSDCADYNERTSGNH